MSDSGWPRSIGRSRLAQRLSVGLCVVVALPGAGWLGASSLVALLGTSDLAQAPPPQRDFCSRPEPGSAVPEPQDLRSQDGVLQVDLAIHEKKQPDGSTRYCYLMP